MPSPYDEYFRPIVNKWTELIEAAKESKKPFDDVAQQCFSFYAARNGFIFEGDFRKKYLNITNENELPRHRLTFNKAYEYVAIFGPLLYWDNPQRVVKPRKQVQFSPDVFGITPQMQQQWQQYQQQLQQYQQALAQFQQAQQAMMSQQPGGLPPGQLPNQGPQPATQAVPGTAPGGASPQGQPQLPPVPQPPQVDPQLMYLMQLWDWSQQVTRQRAVADDIRCRLMEGWLNYTPGEMPFGGLATHSRLAIVEALVKGRGCLWAEPYQFDGSEKRLVGSFYDTVDNLYIDPDATSLSEAKWIAKKIIAPVYQVEEEFALTPGSLEGKGSHIVSGPKAKPIGGTSGGGQADARKDKIGRTTELITYYKIWSKCGVGTKLVGAHVDAEMRENLERVSGKFAFLCVAPGVNYPLNVPADQLEGMSDDDVRQRLEWPYPCWKDDRWPLAVLDFYPHPNRAWPIAPLAPALGELTFLQVVMSHLADRVVKSSRDFIAVLQSAGEEIENKIKNGGDLTVLPLTEVHNDIGKVVQFLQQPSVNRDAWLIVDRVNQLFERRTGLTELMAGQTGTQSRSAADAQIKGNQINVRPEDMQRRVEEWQTEAAKLEKIATRWFIEPPDVDLLFGPVGAYLWQTYITSADPELVIRETDCTIEAGSVRKPNKERDVQNVNSVAQFVGPLLNQIYMQMGNPGPMSWLLRKMADVYDWDTNGLELPAPPAPQPPQADPMQQQMMQMELAERQMDLQAGQQKQVHDVQMLQAKGAMDAQKFQLEMAKLAGQLQLQQAEIEAKKLEAQADAQQTIIEQEYGRRDAEADMLRSQAQLASDAAQIELAQRRAETELQVQQAKAAQELQAKELKTQMELAQQARKAKQRTQLELFGEDPVAKLFDSGKA